MNLDEVMERLKLIANEPRIAGVLRWLGVSASSYANWRRRGTIPYRQIVEAMLARNLSLDVFFSPQVRLDIPPNLEHEVQDRAAPYPHCRPDVSTDEMVAAVSKMTTLLERHGATPRQDYVSLLVDLYLLGEGQQIDRLAAVEQLAASLSYLEGT